MTALPVLWMRGRTCSERLVIFTLLSDSIHELVGEMWWLHIAVFFNFLSTNVNFHIVGYVPQILW